MDAWVSECLRYSESLAEGVVMVIVGTSSIGNILANFGFFRPTQKLPRAPNGAGRFFFRLIQTLPTFWATWILISRIFIFLICLGPKFLAWAQLGPTHLGPAWAHPLGPGVGPPTWARLGPTGAHPIF